MGNDDDDDMTCGFVVRVEPVSVDSVREIHTELPRAVPLPGLRASVWVCAHPHACVGFISALNLPLPDH